MKGMVQSGSGHATELPQSYWNLSWAIENTNMLTNTAIILKCHITHHLKLNLNFSILALLFSNLASGKVSQVASYADSVYAPKN